MSKLLRGFGAVACAVTVVACAASAQATIGIVQADTTTYNNPSSPSSGISAWIVTPNAADSTAWTSESFTSYAANIGQFGSSDQNTTSMGQSFAATASGTLSDIQIIVSGNPSGLSLNLALYDAGSATGSIFANTGSQTYTPGTNVSANLLAADATGVVLPAYTTQGANGAVLDFQLSGEGVSLTAGEEYIFELNTLSNSAMFWGREANNTLDYPNGQAFKARSPLNGNSLRDWSLAVTVVPEPGSLVLLGLAAPAMLWAARKQK